MRGGDDVVAAEKPDEFDSDDPETPLDDSDPKGLAMGGPAARSTSSIESLAPSACSEE